MNRIQNQSGFTLVELMVVVAIIGILASIAIPNYQKYQARARQSEAKIALSGIYTAEVAFSVEQSSYTVCLYNIGYIPTTANFAGGVGVAGALGKSYYAVGFGATAATSTTCGTTGATACNTYDFVCGTTCSCPAANGYTYYYANSFVYANANAATISDTPLATALAAQTTFTAVAGGNISNTAATYDTWTITNNNALVNTNSAL